MSIQQLILLLAIAGSLSAQTSSVTTPSGSPEKPSSNPQLLEVYGKLPMSFEANQGQSDPRVKFLSRGSGYTLFLTANEAVLSLQGMFQNTERHSASQPSNTLLRTRNSEPRNQAANTAVLRMKLVGGRATTEVSGLDELPGKSNYFIGNDPGKWHARVRTYSRVRYKEAYPGIDLIYYGNQRQLEYDFVVAPGADPRTIRVRLDGARKMRIDRSGDLVLKAGKEEIRLHKPVVYQVPSTGGSKKFIAGRYVLKGEHEVGFAISAYDPKRALVIDPVLSFSTFFGGGMQSQGSGIAVDSAGNAYVTGYTRSPQFFPLVDPLQPAYGGGFADAFVAKIDTTTPAILYSTYLGGSDYDFGSGIAVDSAGKAYVTGSTASSDFPTANALQPANQGGFDAFVAVLDPTGSSLLYSTYLGGSGDEFGSGIAVDSAGNAYVTGATGSADFPTANALQPTFQGGVNANYCLCDAFVTVLTPNGSGLVYSTYLGGSDDDVGEGIAVDGIGNAYVTGFTFSSDFPTANPLQATNHSAPSGANAFVAALDPTGSTLRYSTYLGGRSNYYGDWGTGIALDSAGNAYIVGIASSTDFPLVNPLQPNFGGSIDDAFVAKLNPTGSALLYSTYLGGSLNDAGVGIAVDSTRNAYVTGFTSSTNFPTAHPVQPSNNGGDDAFVAVLDPNGSALLYSTYLGGSSQDSGNSIAVDTAGNAYLTGYTYSGDFPLVNPLPATGPGTDGFVAKIAR